MRDKLADRWRTRDAGATDPRIASAARKLSITPDIPNVVGTPVIWLDPEVIAMTAGTEQGVVTDRAGVQWDEITLAGAGGGRSVWQVPNGLNTRNCFLSDGPDDTDAQAGVSTYGTSAITIGSDFTVFVVIRMNSFAPSNTAGSLSIFLRQQVSAFDQTFNFHLAYTNAQKFSFQRSGAGTVATGAASNPGMTHVITAQSTSTRNEIWLDGTVGANANPGTSVTNPMTLYLGSAKTDEPIQWYTRAYFGDIIIYNSILSSANRNAVEKYLGRKYGVTIA